MTKKEYVKRTDYPKILPKKKTFYCLICKKSGVEIVPDKNEKYFCKHCKSKSSRCLIFDPRMMYDFDQKNNLVHYGGGMFVVNKEDKILLFLKRKYPYLYAVPGGHLTFGEDPKECAVREVKEEVGLDVILYNDNYFPLLKQKNCQGLIPPQFMDRHRINPEHEHLAMVYFAKSKTDQLILSETEKSEECKWFTKEELDNESISDFVRLYARTALEKLTESIIY